MKKTDKSFDELLSQRSSWVYKGDDIFVTLGKDPTLPESFYFQYEVHASEFAKFHPLLPKALVQHVESSLQKNYRFSLSGNHLAMTLRMLEEDHIEYLDNEGKTIRVFDYVLAESSSDIKQNISLSGIFVGTTVQDVESHTIHFVDSIAYDEVNVAQDTLEAAYPGWFERWKIAIELGLDRETIRGFVLSKKPTARIQASPPLDVTFDLGVN